MALAEVAIAAGPQRERRRMSNTVFILAARRLALTLRPPRALVIPLVAPVLFALVIAPALADTIARPGDHTTYMTFVALSTVGLLAPMNCLFAGLGVITDRQYGAMRELLAAPIRRSSIIVGNLLAAVLTTAIQLGVLIGFSVARGATFTAGAHVVWFLGGALLLIVTMYSLAEVLASRVPSAEAYVGAVPAVAIVPYFLAGSLFPLSALPHWLAGVAKVIPLTHALALIRYGLTPTDGGVVALHNIWGLSSAPEMAALSLLVLALYSAAVFQAAVRLFAKRGTS